VYVGSEQPVNEWRIEGKQEEWHEYRNHVYRLSPEGTVPRLVLDRYSLKPDELILLHVAPGWMVCRVIEVIDFKDGSVSVRVRKP
jgi:hypothetical protein